MISRADFFTVIRRDADLSTEELYAAYEFFSICPGLSADIGGIIDPSSIVCRRCGNCCRHGWRVEATFADVMRWASQGRFDIISSLVHVPRKYALRKDPYHDSILKRISEYLWELDDENIASIAQKIFISTYFDGSLIIQKNKGGCIYHEEPSSCAIYDTKPGNCRIFPGVR